MTRSSFLISFLYHSMDEYMLCKLAKVFRKTRLFSFLVVNVIKWVIFSCSQWKDNLGFLTFGNHSQKTLLLVTLNLKVGLFYTFWADLLLCKLTNLLCNCTKMEGFELAFFLLFFSCLWMTDSPHNSHLSQLWYTSWENPFEQSTWIMKVGNSHIFKFLFLKEIPFHNFVLLLHYLSTLWICFNCLGCPRLLQIILLFLKSNFFQ